LNGNGKADGSATAFRGARKGREAEEGFHPRKVDWWQSPKAWTTWTWREREDQFQTWRKYKYQV